MARKPRFESGRSVGMNNTLGGRAIELGDGHAKFCFGIRYFAGRGCFANLANFGFQLRLRGTILRAEFEVLTMTFTSTSDIGHRYVSDWGLGVLVTGTSHLGTNAQDTSFRITLYRVPGRFCLAGRRRLCSQNPGRQAG